MVKGEGLRVVKHNRSGGSQVRIIRYDPDIKALVWNSKRYMKKGKPAGCCGGYAVQLSTYPIEWSAHAV